MSTISAGTTSTTTLVATGDTTGSLVFKTNDTGSGGTAAMTIDTSQNVGIGTSSPISKLDSRGSAYLGADSNVAVYAYSSSTEGRIGVGGRSTVSNVPLTFYVADGGANTERMRIDSSGNLLVGKTTTATTSLGWSLGSGLGNAKFSAGNYMIFNRDDNDILINFRRSDTSVGTITVTTTATAYNTSSDYRLKHDIQPMSGALAKVAALKPVTYKWNADDSAGEGFIAHELAEVVPQCVTGEKDAVDADGNPIYQGIDTSFLVATLTAAIQELKALNDAQASTITQLTERISALENK